MSVLNINDGVQFDESVSGIEYRTHEAFTGSKFDNNDEIRISIQNQDSYTLPCESFIYLEGRLTKSNGNAVENTKFINNAFSHLISEIRYLINGVEIDKTRNVGYTSYLKGIASFSKSESSRYGNSGWGENNFYDFIANDGSFNIIIKLSLLMGFFEDYRKVLLNCKQELVLIRSQNDSNCILTTPVAAAAPGGQPTIENIKVTISKLNWRMPYVNVADQSRLKLLGILQADKPILLGFRSWNMFEKPLLPTNKIEWQVQTTTNLEKPRFVLLALQNNGRNHVLKNANTFHASKIRNVKLHLNGKNFPYDNLNLDTAKNKIAMLYEMYANFREQYYEKECSPYFTISEFLEKSPIVVIDCSKQNDSVKSGAVDVRLEIEADENFPDGTIAYCLIIHDRIVEYTPLTNLVRLHV